MSHSVRRIICLSALLSFALPLTSTATDMQTLFNTESFQLQYEIIFKATSQGTYTPPMTGGSCNYTTSMERHFTKSYALNMRTGGPSVSTVRSAMTNPQQNTSIAEAQKRTMELLAKTEHTATWMNAGMEELPDDATDEQQQAAGLAYMESMKGHCTVDYTIVNVCTGLTTEMGTVYDQTSKSHYVGSAKVRNMDQIMMEMDASAQKYILMLGYSYMDDSSSSVQIRTDTHSQSKGEPPHDTTTFDYTSLETPVRNLVVDDSSAVVGMNLYLEGNINPATGKIVGEHNVRAHYSGFVTETPGILTIRFTLTPKQ